MPPAAACQRDSALPDADLWEHIRRDCEGLTHGSVEIVFHDGRLTRWDVLKKRVPPAIPPKD